MALRHKAAKSILWSGLESGSTSLIAFLSLVVLAKLLQPRDFGVFSVSLAVVETAGIFTNMIFHDALVQQSVVTEKHFDSAFTVSIVLSLIVYALLWIAFPYVALAVQDDRVELETVGWGRNEESWSLDHQVIEGDPDTPAVWAWRSSCPPVLM